MPGNQQPTRASVLTAETLSFSIAASIVSTLLQLANIQWAGAPTDFWWALATSAIVGLFIVAYQWPEPPATKPKRDPSERGFFGMWWWDRGFRTAFGAVGVGLLNILLVTAAVLGVGSAVEGEAVVDVPAVTSE
ncbi:MAG: hypothetical protein WBG36_15325 [Ornithinimicrobium sp.]